MAFIHVASGTGSDQDLLDLARASYAQVLANGQSFTDENGRSIVLPSLADLAKQITALEAKVGTTSGPATNLAQFVREPAV